MIAAALAVELMVSVVQHPLGSVITILFAVAADGQSFCGASDRHLISFCPYSLCINSNSIE